MKHKLFIIMQMVFITAVITGILIFYPRADLNLDGTRVNFNSINADVIIISENPDFSDSRYVEVNRSTTFNLRPGKYYWKASNDFIEGFPNEFVIDSKVGLEIVEKGDEQELKNIGNVKVNVSRTEDGGFVGHIILEPEESEEIIDEGVYTGRQDG